MKMKFSTSASRRSLSALGVVLLLVLSACGGGDNATPFNTATSGTIITGAVVKGPVNLASVCAYSLASGSKGSSLGACAISNARGAYTLSLPTTTGPVLLEASGGTYIDEATNTIVSVPSGVIMTSVANASSGTLSAAITPLTTLAFNAARAAGTVTTASFAQQATNVLTALGITPTLNITTATPVTTGTPDGYGQALINFSRVIASGTTLASITSVTDPLQLQVVYRTAAATTATLPSGTPTVATPSVTATAAPIGSPALSFVMPQESLDLANYTLVAKYALPVGTGSNLLASEASAVTYNADTDTLFMVGDSGTSITQFTKTGQLIDTMTLPADASKPQGTYFYDPEGLTYVGNGQFVLVEERYRQVNLFTYVAGTTLNPANVKTVKLGTTIGNIGIEGVSYDPMTGGFVFAKEKQPMGLFQSTINFNVGTASNGSATTENSVNLFDPTLLGLLDFGDLAALSNVLPGTAPDYSHLVLLSQESARIVKTDRAGKIYSQLDFELASQTEGITFDKQLKMYTNNELGTGGTSGPELWVWQPTRSAAAVGRGSNLYLTFNTDVLLGTGNLILSNGAGDARTIAVSDATQVRISGKTVVINPATDLQPGTGYSVQYAAGAFKDGAGNAAPAVNSPSMLSFTTVADITAPALVSTSPAKNAGAVTTTASITLGFDEAVRAGTGSFTISNGSDDVRIINANDASQVTVSGSSVSIKPTTSLRLASIYFVLVSANALSDMAGNRFVGVTDVTRLKFATATPVMAAAPMLLITEVNSNAAGGDFFELYNYGTAAIDITGWKWGDNAFAFSAVSVATFSTGTVIAPGQRLLVVNVLASLIPTFRSNWGLSADFPVAATDIAGSGLGKGDAVVVYNAFGLVMASLNYGADAASFPHALPSAGATFVAASHAGPAFGAPASGADSISLVWDGISTSSPTYKPATVGVLGAFAQPAAASAIGSPGQ